MILKLKKKLNAELNQDKNIKIVIGDYITIGMQYTDGNKFRIQEYSGIVIKKSTKNSNSIVIIQTNRTTTNITYGIFISSPLLLYIYINYSLITNKAKLIN